MGQRSGGNEEGEEEFLHGGKLKGKRDRLQGGNVILRGDGVGEAVGLAPQAHALQKV